MFSSGVQDLPQGLPHGTAPILGPDETWPFLVNWPLLRNFGENRLLLKRNHSAGARVIGLVRRKMETEDFDRGCLTRVRGSPVPLWGPTQAIALRGLAREP